MRKPQVTEQQIMQAALQIAAEKGAGKVTLDAVAKASGLSKGGLLYHFPSKEALIAAMLQHLIDDSERNRSQLAANEPSSALVALLKARALFTERITANTAMAILAAGAEQPALLNPIKHHNTKVLTEILTGQNQPLEVMLLMLASEGLIFQDLLNISPYSAEQKAALEDHLIKRAQELSE